MEVCWYGPQPRRFADPVGRIETRDLAGVASALADAETALAQGYAVAGYLAYEAGAAFVAPATTVARVAEASVPLVALGIYRPADASTVARDFEGGDGTSDDVAIGPLVAQIEERRFTSDLDAIARALRAGDVYQINYTVPFAFSFAGDPRALFARLRARAKVPYAAFVSDGDRALISLSPERFFTIDGDRLTTRPMKGTSAPGARAHLRSVKNRAEHVMIVDLLRNDMHRVCDRVDVDPLFAEEAYPTFATMTSTLAGRLRDDARLRDVFAALFPCGSITGAPKRSAMAQIARLEGARRGVAMGTIGYCDGPRRGNWNVAIRTATLDRARGTGEVRIGGGIVADSDARSEWAEVLVKRRAFAPFGAPVGLIETLRLEIDGTFVAEAAHRERLARSAFALGLSYDDARVTAALETSRASSGGRNHPVLARLTLAPEGTIAVDVRSLDEVSVPAPICMSDVVVRANDPALRHKTTARDAYDAAGAFARARGCFEGLICNERGELADGGRTTLFVEAPDGTLLTPPLDGGALAGVLRADLIASGRAREAVLRASDLANARLSIGNSARGLIPAALISRAMRDVDPAHAVRKASYTPSDGAAVG